MNISSDDPLFWQKQIVALTKDVKNLAEAVTKASKLLLEVRDDLEEVKADLAEVKEEVHEIYELVQAPQREGLEQTYSMQQPSAP